MRNNDGEDIGAVAFRDGERIAIGNDIPVVERIVHGHAEADTGHQIEERDAEQP